jgi:hypothetical protein
MPQVAAGVYETSARVVFKLTHYRASIPIPAQVVLGLVFVCLLLIAALEGRKN